MALSIIDWCIIAFFFVVAVIVGAIVSKKAGKDSGSFFLSNRNMPWWLLGTSMVTTTFSTDTPNLVANIVRNDGVSGNWVWWCFLITGMLTCFVYAKIWRRTNVFTDLEFYEMRYSGKAASAVRANAVVLEAVQQGMVAALSGYEDIRSEVKYGESSRADLLLSDGGRRCYVEVKSVTLRRAAGAGAFPDAVSARAAKHLRELQAVARAGDKGGYFLLWLSCWH